MQSWTNSLMPPAPVPVRVVSPRSLASCLHRSCLASNIPGCSRMTQACFSGPNGSALQFSANAVGENAAEKPINAKMILSIAIIGLVSISASSNEYPCPRYQTPEHTQRGIKHKSRVRGPQPQRGTSAVCPEILPKKALVDAAMRIGGRRSKQSPKFGSLSLSSLSSNRRPALMCTFRTSKR